MKDIKTRVATDPKEQPTAAQQPATTAGAQEFPTQYQGIHYSRIVEAWLEARGISGDVLQGARNVTYFQMARDMRYLTDFNIDFLFHILPRWGMSEQEARQTLAQAIATARGSQLPHELQRLLNELTVLGDQPSRRLSLRERNPFPHHWPPLFRDIARQYPETAGQMILASLPELGTLLTNLRAQYLDGRWHAPIFFVIMPAPQAGGKSNARDLSDMLIAPIQEDDARARQQENEYKERLRRAKNTKDQPQDPRPVIRHLPASISNAALLKRADNAAGQALYTFADEIDTIVRGNKAGAWSEKSDIYRMAFDGSKWGQDYLNDSSYSGVVELRYNLLFLGTPLAVKDFFRRVEDGMASRFIVAPLPDNRGEELVAPRRLARSVRLRMEDLIRRAYHEGRQAGEVQLRLPRTLKALGEWQKERIREFNLNPSNVALDILRRRSGVIAFRAAMLAWWLCDKRETREVTDFALWVANEVLDGQLTTFGDQLNEVERRTQELQQEREQRSSNSRNLRLLDLLPDPFIKADLAALRRRDGDMGECAYIISRWLKAGLIVRLPDGRYQKVKEV